MSGGKFVIDTLAPRSLKVGDKVKVKLTEIDKMGRVNLSMKDLEPVTTDGHKVILSANIGSVEDLESALEFGARTVGLVRTEFL